MDSHLKLNMLASCLIWFVRICLIKYVGPSRVWHVFCYELLALANLDFGSDARRISKFLASCQSYDVIHNINTNQYSRLWAELVSRS